jgi:DNA gyrase subunit B
MVNISFAFNNEVNLIEYYHNSSFLENGGTPEDFIKNAFTYAIDNYIKINNLYKKNESKIKFADIQDSLILISDTYSTISLYTDQVKKKINSKFMNTFVTNFLKEQLSIYFIENKLEAEKIINQCLINKRANDKAAQTKLDIKAKLTNNKKGLTPKIEGLYHCDFRHSTLEERMFIVDEGLSANDTITNSFDNRIMGAYGLRGRFINSLKASVKDVLNNEPALGIINGLGCGIEIPKEEKKNFKDIKTYNQEDLLYGKFGILCDRDCWGSGISLSLITFVWRFMKPLLKQGRVYLGISPRYELELKNETSVYAYNDKDKDSKIQEVGENNIKAITIRKGLGEFNSDEFYNLILSEEAREKAFIQIQYNEDLEEMIGQYFDILMGNNIEGRKQFIQDRILNIDLNNLE